MIAEIRVEVKDITTLKVLIDMLNCSTDVEVVEHKVIDIEREIAEANCEDI